MLFVCSVDLFSLYEQFPTSAAPLYAYIIFGLDNKQPLEYGNRFNEYEYVASAHTPLLTAIQRFEAGKDGSGSPVYNLSFDISDPLFQVQ